MRFLIVVIAMALILPFPALADSTEIFAYTSDFDSGTFSVSQSAREVNTESCNAMIPENSITLDNIAGDSFCVDDSDGVTWKWIQGTSSADAAPDLCEVTIDNGFAKIFRNYTSGGAIRSCFFIGTSTFSGDFDIRLSWQYINTAVNGNPRPILCVWDTQFVFLNWGLNCDNANQYEGAWYQYIRTSGFAAFLHPSGGPSFQIGGLTTVTACDTIGTDCWFRITRIGNLYSWYYSVEGNGWILDETTTDSSFVNPLYGWFGTVTNTQLDDGEIWFDNYSVEATVDAGGYRISGDWISGSFTVANDSIRLIDVNFIELAPPVTGSSIERLDVRRDSTILESFVNPTFPIVPTTDISGADLNLRIFFIGNGSVTVIVHNVIVVALEGAGELVVSELVLMVVSVVAWLLLFVIGFYVQNGILCVLGSLIGVLTGLFFVIPISAPLGIAFIGVAAVTLVIGIFLFSEE